MTNGMNEDEKWDRPIIISGQVTNNGKAVVTGYVGAWKLLLKILERDKERLSTPERLVISLLVREIRDSLSGSC